MVYEGLLGVAPGRLAFEFHALIQPELGIAGAHGVPVVLIKNELPIGGVVVGYEAIFIQ